MSFWEYERIRHAQAEWHEAELEVKKRERTQRTDGKGKKSTPSFNQPLSPNYGPQFIIPETDEKAKA